jgi:AraC-like DNA-binding protein
MRRLEYLEKRQRGTAEFPIELYRLSPESERYVMQCHWHLEYEIIAVKEGYLSLILDERKVTAGSGDIVLLPEGTLHTGEPESCVYDCVVFSRELISERGSGGALRELFRRLPKEEVFSPKKYPKLHTCVHKLIDTLEKRASSSERTEERISSEATAIGLIYQFFGEALSEGVFSDRAVEGKRHTDQLKRVIGYIEENYREEIPLSALAGAAGLSPKYLCRLFTQLTGKSPVEYVNEYRIDRACVMLSDTDVPILDVGLSCGFNDQSYFIKTFRKYKNTTPGAYRKSFGL